MSLRTRLDHLEQRVSERAHIEDREGAILRGAALFLVQADASTFGPPDEAYENAESLITCARSFERDLPDGIRNVVDSDTLALAVLRRWTAPDYDDTIVRLASECIVQLEKVSPNS